jgi:Tfp pilus assembly protein PilO
MKISKEKRNQLIILSVIAVLVLVGIWYLLIRGQNVALAQISGKIAQARENQRRMVQTMKAADRISEDFEAAAEKMTVIEKGMATGDYYSWMYNTIKEFKNSYRVEIPQFSTVDVGDCSLIYKFPYKQVRMTISGSAFYHDFGRFIADFENHFPHMRLQNLELSSGATRGNSTDREREKLSFRVDVIALAKPNDSK